MTKVTKHTGKTLPYDTRTRKLVIRKHDEGESFEQIQQKTGVSIASQRRFLKQQRAGQPLAPKKVDRKGEKNGNAKVTKEYYAILKKEIRKQKSLPKGQEKWTSLQYRDFMFETTGIRLSDSQICNVIHKVQKTHKL